MNRGAIDLSLYDALVIGSGFSGAVSARQLAQKGKRVLLLERRAHIGGNCYDRVNEDGILIHPYGPHIFHTNDPAVFAYLSQFTTWREYQHKVLANLGDTTIPIPFNWTSLYQIYGEQQAKALQRKLLARFAMGTSVSIRTLRKEEDADLRGLAETIYDRVYRIYSLKQWGFSPEELDPLVLDRVPIRLSQDDRYFTDAYQGMPADGYTALFTNLIAHPNIEVITDCDAVAKFALVDGKMTVGGRPLPEGVLAVYTGAIDALFGHSLGVLPYRTVHLEFETHAEEFFQSVGTVNYTVAEEYTRITEFKHLTGQVAQRTVIGKEYASDAKESDENPAYPILLPENQALHAQYAELAKRIPSLYVVGRLAEYRYYNMDAAVLAAIRLCEQL